MVNSYVISGKLTWLAGAFESINPWNHFKGENACVNKASEVH